MIKIKRVLFLLAILIVAFPFNAFGAGACCWTDGSCHINNNQGDCEEGEGFIWQGDDTLCDPNPCQQDHLVAIPTLNEWGMMIFMALAGLGATYYLRRQKTAKS